LSKYIDDNETNPFAYICLFLVPISILFNFFTLYVAITMSILSCGSLYFYSKFIFTKEMSIAVAICFVIAVIAWIAFFSRLKTKKLKE
jgi:hypothetical protein